MISDRISRRRNVEDMSIDELSSVSGLSCAQLKAFEANIETPNSTELLQLAHALGVKVAYFFRETLNVNLEMKHV